MKSHMLGKVKKTWEELGDGELIQNILYKKSIFNEKQKDHGVVRMHLWAWEKL